MQSTEPTETERRVTPRFQTTFGAELAAGSAVVPVLVHDLSMMGCGVEILSPDPDLADRLGTAGLLKLPPRLHAPTGVILPVLLCNMRLDKDRLRYGLRFARLSPRQTRSLIGTMDALLEEDPETSRRANGGSTSTPRPIPESTRKTRGAVLRREEPYDGSPEVA